MCMLITMTEPMNQSPSIAIKPFWQRILHLGLAKQQYGNRRHLLPPQVGPQVESNQPKEGANEPNKILIQGDLNIPKP